MADDSEFLSRLISFGLSEKEAQLYLHLLKYGPKPSSMLAKSLKTYREDIYRTLNGLVDKGMVNPSIESPTVYVATELNIALDAALKKHESELREMELRKKELQEISKQQRFSPSDELPTYKIIKSLREGVDFSISGSLVAEQELLTAVPGPVMVVASRFGINEGVKTLIARGGHVRCITDVSHSIIEAVQESLSIGVAVRHLSQYRGIYFGVYDRKFSVTSINIDFKRMSLDESISVLYSDDPVHASYLVSTFEFLWEQSVPAAQRIEELLKERALHS